MISGSVYCLEAGIIIEYLYSAAYEITPGKVYARVPDLPGCITTGKDLNVWSLPE